MRWARCVGVSDEYVVESLGCSLSGVVGRLVGDAEAAISCECFVFNDTATTEIYTRALVGSVRCV